MYHADILTKNGYSLANLSDCCDEVIDYIPGISPTRLADMPLLPSGNDPNFNPTIAAFNMLEKVQSLLIVSFYELEPQVTDTLKAIFPFPIYTVGPSISNISTAIEQHHHIDGKKTELNTVKYVNPKEPDYIEWLDSQPVGSVLYIAFGSTVPIPGVHVEEIMAGLHKSGVRYLLVSCGVHEGGEDDKMGTNSRRLIVPWSDQLRVLCHSSIGGFLTHCGWNSTMESLYAGVPMLTFPIFLIKFPTENSLWMI
ncbi:UDP-glycosyltransferase 87A2-like [Papaver somniferum]|uniref:UDP-glycosyltransferase 87A2-like n=1 Tax=Papaver somniferum TaxID=3469 RepID=UPI000E705738|nr:UDP-glycosyltransferase 87A2-like [Papaver somniferum]